MPTVNIPGLGPIALPYGKDNFSGVLDTASARVRGRRKSPNPTTTGNLPRPQTAGGMQPGMGTADLAGKTFAQYLDEARKLVSERMKNVGTGGRFRRY